MNKKYELTFESEGQFNEAFKEIWRNAARSERDAVISIVDEGIRLATKYRRSNAIHYLNLVREAIHKRNLK